MYHGHYFKLDIATARVERGSVVFRYRPDGKTDSSVYVSFTGNEIAFQSIGDNSHGNALILRIAVDDATPRLFSNMEIDAIHGNIRRAATAPEELSGLSYYSTFYFAKESAAETKYRSYWKKSSVSFHFHGSPAIPDPLSVRKLLLDFLFDWQETGIFQVSPHFNELSEAFHRCYFFRCLLAKARYWYHRAVAEEALRRKGKTTDAVRRGASADKARFYEEMVFHAEASWTHCIRDIRSDAAFHEELYDWFDEPEMEMRRVYAYHRPLIPLKELERAKRIENDRAVSKWFVARYAWAAPIRILLDGNTSFFGFHLFLPRLIFAIVTAWFSLAIFQTDDRGKEINDVLWGGVALALLFSVSVIIVRRIIPVTRIVFQRSRRALGLTVATLAMAIATGALVRLIRPDIGSHPLYYISSAAVIGLVLNIFLQGANPGESL